jgi:hypothetical protein
LDIGERKRRRRRRYIRMLTMDFGQAKW